MRREAAACPVREALAPLSGPVRFGRLRDTLVRPDGTAVSAKVLAADLRRLAEAGVVERGPQGVSYRLSERGRALVPLLDALAEWADGPEPARAPSL